MLQAEIKAELRLSCDPLPCRGDTSSSWLSEIYYQGCLGPPQRVAGLFVLRARASWRMAPGSAAALFAEGRSRGNLIEGNWCLAGLLLLRAELPGGDGGAVAAGRAATVARRARCAAARCSGAHRALGVGGGCRRRVTLFVT